MTSDGAIRPHAEGVTVELYVQPRASRTRCVGDHDGALKVAVAAPPVDGEANAELCAWLARCLGVAKRDVALLRGEASRRKTLLVRGVDVPTARQRLASPA